MSKRSDFVHLHNHTEYSFLDGAIRIKSLVEKAKEFGMPALAITDHGGMFGVVEFYNACLKEGIKPIIGFEAYVAPQSRLDKTKSGDENYHHLILLARNLEGYKNLMRLSTIGYLEGFYYRPRIDNEVLRKYSAGVIATSACVAGAIPRALLSGDTARAQKIAEEYIDIFGKENFFFELQNHGIDKELVAFDELIKLGRRMGVPFIVANDAHYLTKDDASSHEVLLCIGTQTTLDDQSRFRFGSDQIYFKSAAEMAQLFPDMPEALANTVAIAERCSVDIKAPPQLPKTKVPDGFASEAEYLSHLAKAGLKEKYSRITPGIQERLDYELGVICKMGFEGYFLIVSDFVAAAKREGVMTGCRGSAAGSLVAYSIGITDVDPIRFELLFERFLNPERIDMPDADIDFADRDRYKIIDYVIKRYGRDAVCQIITYGRMKGKSVVRDVARVMGLTVAEAGKLAAMVDKDLATSLSTNGELAATIKANPKYAELFRHARALEGLNRQPSMHAGGVIIAPGPVVNWSPLFKQPDADEVMTQFDMNDVKEVGLIKMDFLGLITLTILQDTIDLVKQNHGVVIDLWKLPDGDKETLALLGRGETVGVFQFESQGMQDNLRKLKPEGIEDLIAMNALYRPGPMEDIPVYIHRKHGREKVEYRHPLIEEILKITYGVITYQEQVMRVAQEMGGFTLGQADILRKAMGKKDMEKMEAMRKRFMEGAQKRKVEAKIAQEIFDRMAKFAGYGFNKAHATVYAHVAYQCAYLKAHYPIEFLTANLSSVLDKKDDLLVIKNEAERMGIKILPPDVNTSDYRCSIDGGRIRLGLGTIKNVGKAAEKILEARAKKGKFSSLFDLCASVDLHLVNKKALESLVYAGALDSLKGSRARLFAGVDAAIDYGSAEQKDRASGQTSLFETDDKDSAARVRPEPPLPDVEAWPYNELLAREKEVLNFYVSGHPLERFMDEVRGFTDITLSAESLDKVREGTALTVGGIITAVKTHTQRDGRPMAFLEIEDFDGSMELLAFGEAYEKFRHLLAPDAMILVRGTVSIREGDKKPKLRVENVIALSETREKLTKSVHVRLRTQGLEDAFVKELYDECGKAAGDCSLIIHLQTQEENEYRIKAKNVAVNPAKETIDLLRNRLGKENVWLSKTAA
ncbi:MAG TPA: DNA polymerase III subunit alpha [Chitinivibrionales bacterium]|nr:DNA polymerase III subunit alpha [Chitinivibrionales bacterium]